MIIISVNVFYFHYTLFHQFGMRVFVLIFCEASDNWSFFHLSFPISNQDSECGNYYFSLHARLKGILREKYSTLVKGSNGREVQKIVKFHKVSYKLHLQYNKILPLQIGILLKWKQLSNAGFWWTHIQSISTQTTPPLKFALFLCSWLNFL